MLVDVSLSGTVNTCEENIWVCWLRAVGKQNHERMVAIQNDVVGNLQYIRLSKQLRKKRKLAILLERFVLRSKSNMTSRSPPPRLYPPTFV